MLVIPVTAIFLKPPESIDKVLKTGDPVPIIEKFRLAGDVAVIDLDAALGRGTNKELIKKLVRMANCRVGGGIRSVEAAIEMLNLGAAKGNSTRLTLSHSRNSSPA